MSGARDDGCRLSVTGFRLVNELLNVSKLESGELPLHPESVDAVTLIRDVITRFAPLTREAHIALDMRVVQDLPELYVDVELIDRVLHNLVDNAVKFTPDGGSIRLWAQVDPGAEDRLILGVTDTGPGIPPGEQPRLFEKFQQTSATGRRMGTGLGLPFCKLAVEAHGGQIWVESTVGQGSTFAMRLPTGIV